MAQLKEGKFTVYQQSDGLTDNTVNSLAWSKRDGLWIGTNKGLNLWQNNRFAEFGAKSKLSDRIIRSLLVDRDDYLWIGTNRQGLMRLDNNQPDSAPERFKSLPDDEILAIYQSSEGMVWVGGVTNGLNCLREGTFRVFSQADGLPDDYMRAVFEDSQRNLWFSSTKSLYRLTDGKLKIYKQPEILKNTIATIAEDQSGNIWLGGIEVGQVLRLRNDELTTFTAKDGFPNNRIRSILADRAGDIWIGTNDGLIVFRNGQFSIFKTKDGLVSNSVNKLHESRDGSLWIGTPNGGGR